MAFASTITLKTVFGNKRVTAGTFGGSAGGNINTGLRICEQLFMTHKGSAVQANAPTVDESLPVAGSAVTVVHDSAAVGYWLAIGY
jgi:hypothetical protein